MTWTLGHCTLLLSVDCPKTFKDISLYQQNTGVFMQWYVNMSISMQESIVIKIPKIFEKLCIIIIYKYHKIVHHLKL